MDINMMLRDMEKHIMRKVKDPWCKDEEPISFTMARPSFRMDYAKKNSMLTADILESKKEERREREGSN